VSAGTTAASAAHTASPSATHGLLGACFGWR